MTRNLHNRYHWELRYCVRCGRLNYVEPRHTSAKCECSPRKIEHKTIPWEYLTEAGTIYDGPPRIGQLLSANLEC